MAEVPIFLHLFLFIAILAATSLMFYFKLRGYQADF